MIDLIRTVPNTLVANFNTGVFCHSDNLLESIMNETPFCTISGIYFCASHYCGTCTSLLQMGIYIGFMHMYVLAQLILWTTFHALGILMGVAFPFVNRQLKVEEKTKYINALMVVTALVLPLFPSLLHLIDGYTISLAPIEFCLGRSIPTTYYTLLLPCSVLMAITTTALIIIFWKILKVHTCTMNINHTVSSIQYSFLCTHYPVCCTVGVFSEKVVE